MSGAFAGRQAQEETEKGRIDKTRVKRYWPGKAPEWAEQQQEEPAARDRVRTEVSAPVIVRRTDDPRMRRLQQSVQQDREEALAERRQIRAAEVVRRRDRSEEPSEPGSDEEGAGPRRNEPKHRQRHESGDEEPDGRASKGKEDEDEEDMEVSSDLEGDVPRAQVQRRQAELRRREGGDEEDEASKRRQAVRERLLLQQREEEARRQEHQQDEEEEEEEEEGSSEYETDDEEDLPGARRMLKPVFVPKHARDTVAEREQQQAAEQALVDGEKKRAESRKEETRALLQEHIAQEAAAAAAAAAGPIGLEDIDTDDDVDAVEAYEAWKGRELRRIKRDREEREALEREAAERERLKNMTEEERAAWERANPKERVEKSKSKWNFMQKYYHKGAFFQEAPDDTRGTAGSDAIFARDYSGPTGEDRFDKSVMPQIMQVKNFGRSGRTKWTHLLSEDTTQVQDDQLYAEAKDTHVRKRQEITASTQVFSKPKKFRR